MRRSSVILSAAFHVLIAFFAINGLPFLARRDFSIPPPIVVEFVEVSKVTETNRLAPQPSAQKPEPAKEKIPPAAAQNTAKEAAPPAARKETPQDKPETGKESRAEVADAKTPPDKGKKDAKKEEPKKPPARDFSSVLKNLAAPKTPAAAQADGQKPPAVAMAGQNAPLGQKMTISEEDALRRQLEKCWNVPYGAKDVENMAVDIFMVINPDRTLREARVVDTLRYNTDSFFRAAADSALRAVRSPLCSPFELPPDKYNTWNTVTVTFNPKDMF